MVKAWKILGAFFLLAVCGCATITGTRQKVKIATQPEGAKIYYKEKYIGTTPGFFEIPRNQDTYLRFDLNGKTEKDIHLETAYRWGDSFFSNFIWVFWGAPLGWGVDYLSGAAWDYDSPGQVSLTPEPFKNKVAIPEGRRRIAIAPPQSNYVLLSDELAPLVEKKLRALYSRDEVIPFSQTERIFTNYSYTSESKVSVRARDDLYSELVTTHIAETTVERTDEDVIVKGALMDEFTDRVVNHFTFVIPKNKLETFTKHSATTEFFSKALDIVPNNISYGFKTPAVGFEFEDSFAPVYKGSLDSAGGALNYLAALGFKNARNPKLVKGLHPVFRFVPSVTVDYTKIKFDREGAANALSGMVFDWYLLSIGIGPEIGLESSIGYFYLQFIPGLGTSYIYGRGQNSVISQWGADFELEAELGYLFFISNRINLRFYVNSSGGYSGAWKNALSFMAGSNIPVTSATDTVSGLAIGYYFPESENTVKHWLF